MDNRPEVLEKPIVLIVDDTPENLLLMSSVLKDSYRVKVANNGEQALRIAMSNEVPALILLDVMMPGMNGYEVCRRLKREGQAKSVPVIFVTSKDAVEDEAAGFDAGGVDYIVKPVNPLLLKARVRTHIELERAREDLERRNEVLKENSRLREEVESIIRHDMKSPLMVILNLPRILMLNRAGNDEHIRYLKMIEDSGRKMLGMINSSIDLYKMENGTYVADCVSVDALRVVRQVADTFLVMAEEKAVGFEILVDGEAPSGSSSVCIKGEELLFYTLCANLVKNAVEASPRFGTVTLALEEGPDVTLSIRNRGTIPEGIRGRFFEKFATAGKEKGTGLGAYSASLIARTLGGSIGFETSEEKGTTITVKLPRG